MQLKDYYQLLKLEPSASVAEIKKAYRKLAHRYHPDKNNNDPYAMSLFAEIKEAYEVLTDPAKKEYYLQQRWYNHSIGKKTNYGLITPESILKQTIELEKYVSKIDIFRMDKSGLQQYILELICDSTIEKLHQFKETEINRQIVFILCKAIRPLPKNISNKIFSQLYKLSGNDLSALNKLNEETKHSMKRSFQEKSMPVLLLIITIILCLLIYLISR
jgi:curved DNA-binding protein CbpA